MIKLISELSFLYFFYWFTDVAAEKNQQTLIAGIEAFDPAKLKHTETQEKNPLPDKTGKEYFTNLIKYY